MVILGIDTSLRSTGYGVLETRGSSMASLEHGNIPNGRDARVSECLVAIRAKVSELVAKWSPDVVSVEKVIYGKNANTMMVLGEARGAVIVAAAEAGLPIYEYEPRRVKMSVCGNGMAEKGQVQRMVKTLLALPELPQNDAADALALAICHAHAKTLIAGRDNQV
ncbi:MAG: crossover junction endodeoxyribonuclease RuvC [Kiritimatiellae bacterium]|nr:crossover junction endodeoxyribonuclease RuvC [Kiritimatiellia bacterium]